MMKRLIWLYLVIIFIILAVITQGQIEKSFRYPFGPITTLKARDTTFVDFWGILLGLRRLSADLAWINVLQYYGTHMDEEGRETEESTQGTLAWGEYKELLSRCQTVIRIDPYFRYAYLYGAGALAFNHKRFDEAIELLQEGVRNNPNYWRFQLYLAVIGFLRKEEYKKVVPLLEQVALVPEAPTMLRSILAQIYEKNHQYDKAKLLWEYILNTATEEDYIKKAKKHLEKLKM